MVISANISRVNTNGPFAYLLHVDGVGEKAADNQANMAVAFDAVKADIVALLGGAQVKRVVINVETQ